MITQLKHIIFYFYLRFIRNKKNTDRTPVSLQHAKSIGILFQADNIMQNDKIADFAQHLKATQKDVQLLGYIPKRAIGISYPFPFISDKESNWFGKPGGGTSGYFTHTPFDLLINFCTDECLPLEYIFSVAAAKYRVGFNKDIYNANYDLILISKENSDISTLILNLERYLK